MKSSARDLKKQFLGSLEHLYGNPMVEAKTDPEQSIGFDSVKWESRASPLAIAPRHCPLSEAHIASARCP